MNFSLHRIIPETVAECDQYNTEILEGSRFYRFFYYFVTIYQREQSEKKGKQLQMKILQHIVACRNLQSFIDKKGERVVQRMMGLDNLSQTALY